MEYSKLLLSFLIICYSLSSLHCQNYFSRSDIIDGLTFPYEIQIITGDDLFIKITKPVTGQTNCAYRSPGNDDEDVEHITSNKVKKWSTETCDIHVANITMSESGFWRLKSYNANSLAQGITIVEVKENNLTLNVSPNEIYSPFEDISPEGTRYCYVLRPDEEKSEFPRHNQCLIPEIDKELEANGIWKVVAGIDGKTDEFAFDIYVNVKVEQLQSSVERLNDANQINFKCNLINSNKIITFCRFLRLADDTGFNIDEGAGYGNYRYYGAGIQKHECGMTIDTPTEIDRSQWKCYIGYSEGGELNTMGAILDARDTITNPSDEITADNVYGLNSTTIKLLCKSKHAIDYCWFTHPSGHRISVSDTSELSLYDVYQYHGTGLKLGDCGVKIMMADIGDSGTWTCHMGTTQKSSIELQKDFTVRVSESHLVASSISKNVVTSVAILIECTSIPVHLPMEYCRFVLPNGQGFSINEDVDSDNAMMGNYYFNPNRKLRDGYCSIIVKHATKEHIGLWTCAGKVTGRNEESMDDFTIFVEDNGLSVASIIGMNLGLAFVLAGIIYIGIRGYRKRSRRLLDDTNSGIDMDA